MNYNKIVQFLENSTGVSKENCAQERLDITKLAFERMYQVDSKKVIVVAGTNGKGSTCATLAHLLKSAGNEVGLYTSPHLSKINERIKYNSCDISDNDFCEAFEYVHSFNIPLSHFEYLTLMACYHFFKKYNVNYAIFEVGLGGTYDATNVIPHDTCIITKLGLDHENYLGHTIEEIAKNKAGIINSPGQTVIHAHFDHENVYKIIHSRDARFIESCSFQMQTKETSKIPEFILQTKYGNAKLALPGKRACENTALALTAFEYLGYNPSLYLKELQNVNWPGRMEQVNIDGINLFLSGDHNGQGIDSLLEILEHYRYNRVHFIVGIANDKNYNAMLDKLSNVKNSKIYLTQTPYKTRYIKDYGKWTDICQKSNPNWYSLFRDILPDIHSDDIAIITGSLYLIGDVKRHIEFCNCGN